MYPSALRRGIVALLASTLLLAGMTALVNVQADPDPNMYIDLFDYDMEQYTPPRKDLEHPLLIHWVNENEAVTNVVIAIELDATVLNETDPMDLGSGTDGYITLNVTFSDDGEQLPKAIIDYYNTTNEEDEDDNELEGYFNVEPTTGDADLWIDLDPDGMLPDTMNPDEEVNLDWGAGVSGDVTPGYIDQRITMGAYIDPDDGSGPLNLVATYVWDVGFFNPEMPPEGDRGFVTATTPSEEGPHVITMVIDIDGNNSDTDDPGDNSDSWDVCIGDCSRPDLAYVNVGEASLMVQPLEVVAGKNVTFFYSIKNDGEKDSSAGLVMALFIQQKDDTVWTKINETDPLKLPIGKDQTFSDDSVLAMSWAVPLDAAGEWDIRVEIDHTNVDTDELDEFDNNNLTWTNVHAGNYLEVVEKKPDLIVNVIAPMGQPYMDEQIALRIEVMHDTNHDNLKFAYNVTLSLWVTDPDLIETQLMNDEGDFGVDPLGPTVLTLNWTPTKQGTYTFRAHVDPGDDITEWSEANNELKDVYVDVQKKLTDLWISEIFITPLNDDSFPMVGVPSLITANITNIGLRNLTGGEQSNLYVRFLIDANLLGEVQFNGQIELGENGSASIPYTFMSQGSYWIEVMVDPDSLIEESDETNNDDTDLRINAVTSMDAWVRNLTAASGLSDRNHPITFDVGFDNLPVGATRRLFFNVSYDREIGPSSIIPLTVDGANYQVSAGGGYLDFNFTHSRGTITIDWTPVNGDNFTLHVDIESSINIYTDNDRDSHNLSITKLTRNLIIESIDTDGSNEGPVQIEVRVLFTDDGDDGTVTSVTDVKVHLMVYKYADGDILPENLVDNLGNQTITGAIAEGQTRSITFEWQAERGDFVIVAIVDPGDAIQEQYESDNRLESTKVEIGGGSSTNGDPSDDDNGGFIPAPSLLMAVALLGVLALLRRRR